MKGKKLKFSVLIFALAGVLALFLIFKTSKPSPQNQYLDESVEIIAPAIIDSLNDIIHVPSLQGGIVKKIHVKVGQRVKKGQTLISLDDAQAKASVQMNKISLLQAKNNLILEEKQLKHLKTQLNRLESIDKRAINPSELREKKHEVKMTTIRLDQSKQTLALARANLKNSKSTLSQFKILAPKDGIILQINAHVDELVGAWQQVVFLGDATKVLVRVSIDERDTRHFTKKASVYLTDVEDNQLKIPLTFIQLDRFIVTQERLNSRVQEALYFFDRKPYPNLAAGKQFDAHIAVKRT